jgi:hypothetical protein
MKAHKKSMKAHKRRVSKTHRRRGDAFGEDEMAFGRRRRRSSFGSMPNMGTPMMGVPAFGKRRRTARVSKKAAMKAFRSFYKRHCAGARRSRFGNGGNPPLNQSMGYEFCPNGQGGVLGFNSTGLFPSPCTSMNTAAAANEMNAVLPSYSSSGYGRRRSVKRRSTKRRSVAEFGRRRRSVAAGGRKRKAYKKKRCTYVGSKKRVSEIGARRRRV